MIASVSTWSMHEYLLKGELSFEDFLDRIIALGAQGVELVDIDFADPSPQAMKERKKICNDKGIAVTSMSLEHDLCQEFARDRRKDVEKVFAWMELSKELGVSIVRGFTGWHKHGFPYPKQMEWVFEGLSKIAGKAEELGIDIVVENHNDVCLGADEILDVFRRIGSQRLYTCPDLYNYRSNSSITDPDMGDESFAELEKLMPLAKNAHMKLTQAVNGNTGDRFLDVDRMIELFRKYNYSGPVALEYMWPSAQELGLEGMENFDNCLRTLVRACGQ